MLTCVEYTIFFMQAFCYLVQYMVQYIVTHTGKKNTLQLRKRLRSYNASEIIYLQATSFHLQPRTDNIFS